MKAGCVVLLAAACAGPALATAQGIERYEETVRLEADGSARVEVDLTLPAGSHPPLTVPMSAGEAGALEVDAPEGVSARARAGRERGGIVIDATGTTERVTLHLAYRIAAAAGASDPPLAHGIRRFPYAFVNATGADIASFTVTVILPPGMVIADVEDERPASVTGEAGRIIVSDGRTAVVVRAPGLGIGDVATVTVSYGPRSSRVPLIVVLATLGAGYLYWFRDLTRPPRPDA